MIPYGKHDVTEEDIEAVNEVLRSDFLTQGAVLLKFEEALCSYTGAKYSIGVNSCTSALHIACRDYTWNDYEKVYLLGFDHNNDEYDNLYANTKHYFNKDSKIRDGYIHENGVKTIRQGNKKTKGWIDVHQSWTEQLLKVVKDHPCLQFIWVNYRGGDFPRLPNLFSKDEKEICQL